MRYAFIIIERPSNRTDGRYCDFVASHPLDSPDDLLRRSHEIAESVSCHEAKDPLPPSCATMKCRCVVC